MFLFVIIIATEEASYKDVVAQAYCSSRSFGLEHYGFPISAVRRNCEFAPNQTCNDICGPESAFATSIEANFPDLDIPAYICLGALWLMLDHPILAPNPGPGKTDAGLLNMVTISYDDCEDTGCGPNYCCCSLTDR